MEVDGISSTKIEILSGEPWNSILGPLLFIAFLKNLTAFKNSYLFADDCQMLISGEGMMVSALNIRNSVG